MWSQKQERTAGYLNLHWSHGTLHQRKVKSFHSSKIPPVWACWPCWRLIIKNEKNTAALYEYRCDLGNEIFRVDFPVRYLNLGGIWAE